MEVAYTSILRRVSQVRPSRNVALRSHCRSAVGRPLTDEEKTISLEAQAGTSASGSRSRQNCCLKYSGFARFPTFISICNRRLHCVVLLRTKTRFQQNRRSPLPITTRSSPPILLHDQCTSGCGSSPRI